jgi:diguanylate cyclase
MGFCFGIRLGRRTGSAAAKTQQFRQWLGDLSQWTANFHRDVETYRAELAGLTEQAEDISRSGELVRPAVVLHLLAQIADANHRLQQRLDDAETRLNHQSAELQEFLSEARTDGLTRLPNRRALDEELTRRLAEWRRYQAPFSLALVDIDRFKLVNDQFGHLVGDRVLHEVAMALRAALRDADFVARFGGEEFAVVMPATTEAAAHRACERAREAVEQVAVTVDGVEVRATVSCGAAQAREGEDAASLLRRADAALYTSKHARRNQCHWHDGQRCTAIGKELQPAPAEEVALCG